MLKKNILSAAFCVMLLATAPAVAATYAETQQDNIELAAQGPQTEAEADLTGGSEENTVQESPIAKKMTQAEKARNAAENDSAGGAITLIAM